MKLVLNSINTKNVKNEKSLFVKSYSYCLAKPQCRYCMLHFTTAHINKRFLIPQNPFEQALQTLFTP